MIRTNVIQSFETAKEKEINIVKELEKKISEGTANENEKTELQQKKVLNEMIKAKEPKDITEHIVIVNNNVEKLFGANTKIESDESRTEIPNEFSLSQNYPNPFNSTTKISFDLPEDGTVKLFIYDLLGREILKLVNNELKTAGRYTVEFNGVNLASGVYFYRLEVNKFVQTKRMVLIK